MELSFKSPSLKPLQNALLTMPLWIFHVNLDKVLYIATLDTMNFLHPFPPFSYVQDVVHKS